MTEEGEKLLSIKDLKTHFFTERGVVKAVDGINLEIGKGKILGLVGESGSGKTVTALSIVRLVSYPGKILNGYILFQNENLLEKNEREMRHIRGNRISMIFQDPMSCLNPVFTVGDQVAEAIRLHQDIPRSEIEQSVVNIFEKVGIPDAKKRLKEHPHKFSGGMRQRVMIAMALSCHPDLLIADEPTTNLDVTIQLQILNLMRKIKRDFKTSILLITHDLGVIAEMADHVAVMYAGKIMEYSDVVEVFSNPLHPYTKALLESVPRLDVETRRLRVIPGTVPELLNPPDGCRFSPRCAYTREVCRKEVPPLIEIKRGHSVACLRMNDIDTERGDNNV
ncbi:MAG: ABC transporter ATP-binding protein [Candidatus Bathyarchaeota archaeon]|nr:ABC transporter ATP-binding protein [Candidatus Bathyarchaeota archaeon]MDH5734186.1 ABC transporter ATP-binding protein [Candidatus Bathyarchaeota archaeon]